MKKNHQIFSDLPLEIGKRYKTKFATGEYFVVSKIEYVDKKGAKVKHPIAFGVYENHKNIGECPLPADRIIHEKKFERTIEICGKCKTPLDEDIEIDAE